jgi:hypothetical protein
MAPEKSQDNRKKVRDNRKKDRIGITQKPPQTRMDKGFPGVPRARARKTIKNKIKTSKKARCRNPACG